MIINQEEPMYNRTKQKALKINLDDSIYGTFAEIGAGQEVARYFFQSGGASKTVAKTMSAYDMIFSDAIYGKEDSGRYVVESRLEKMLDKEYGLLIKRLGEQRKKTRFFAFANTVATTGHNQGGEGHGWIGLRYQHSPNEEPSDLVMHLRMLDARNVLQQQAIGIMGVNIIYGSFYECDGNEEHFINALINDLGPERIEIDMVRVRGPAFSKMDNRILSLQLLKARITSAVMFDEQGHVIQPADVLYKKNILALRGSFRPPTHVNIDMLNKGLEIFKQDEDVDPNNIQVLTEITYVNLSAEGDIDEKDFLARVDLLGALGHKVLISNYHEYYKLSTYLARFTSRKMGVVLGVYNLQEVFNVNIYENLSGGILEALGKLFHRPMTIYVYPSKNETGTSYLNCENLPMEAPLGLIFGYFLQQKRIIDMKNFDPDILHIYSRRVLKMIKKGERGWEKMVPETVASTIKEKNLFGYPRK